MSLQKKNIEKMNFEDAISNLEEIVNKFESGETNLDNLIKEFEVANSLKEHCSKKLNEATLKIEKIVNSKSNEIITEKFDDC